MLEFYKYAGKMCNSFPTEKGALVAQWVKRLPTDLAD